MKIPRTIPWGHLPCTQAPILILTQNKKPCMANAKAEQSIVDGKAALRYSGTPLSPLRYRRSAPTSA